LGRNFSAQVAGRYTRHGRGRGFIAHGAGRELFRRTAAGSAAASEMPALNYAFLLFLEKEEKLQKKKEAQGAFYKPPP
jgi:hypothetical protein